MSWIDRRIKDLEAWKKRTALIRSQAVQVHEVLWSEIKDRIAEAKEKGFPVSTNGVPGKRTIFLEKQNLSGHAFQVDVKLVDAKDRIRASGDRVDLFLELDICPDGSDDVCLKLGDTPISIEDAAFAILDPLLFPQLQKKKP